MAGMRTRVVGKTLATHYPPLRAAEVFNMSKKKTMNPKDLARKPRGFPDKREDVLKAELDMIHRVTSVYRLWGFEGIEITPEQISLIKQNVVRLLSPYVGQRAVAKAAHVGTSLRFFQFRKDEREVYTFLRPREKANWAEEQRGHPRGSAAFFVRG